MPLFRTLLALLACTSLLHAADLRTLSGKTVSGSVVAISDKDIKIRTDNDVVTTPLHEVLALDLQGVRPAGASVRRTEVRLIDDSVLSCNDVAFKGNEVKLKLLGGQECTVPLASLISLFRDAQDPQLHKEWDKITSSRAKRDRAVLLRGGELNEVEGTFGDVDPAGKKIQFRVESGNIIGVSLDNLRGLIFYRTTAAAESPVCTVFDTDGNLLAATAVGFNGGKYTITTPAGARIVYEPQALARLDYNRGKLTYLSDLDPARMVEHLYAEPLAHYRRDANLDGQPIFLAGRQHAKGLSLHSHTELEYNLGGKYKEFKAILGVDSRAEAESQSLVRALVTVECDGEKRFSKVISARSVEPIALNIRDVGRLRLIVQSADSANVLNSYDYVAFAEARVSQ
jgi:NPCBM/NEW2 domain